MKRILKCVLFAILILSVMQGISSVAEEDLFRGLNPNQPLSPGDWIYKTYAFIKSPVGGISIFTIVYKGAKENNILIECNTETKSEQRGNNIETKAFKLPLDSKKQTFLNTLTQEFTLLVTLIDENNRIAFEKTEYKNNVPIRFYPDLLQGAAYHSDDVDPEEPLLR